MNLGKALNKAEQKSILGGFKKNDPNCDIMLCCDTDGDCPFTYDIYGDPVPGWCSTGGYCNV